MSGNKKREYRAKALYAIILLLMMVVAVMFFVFSGSSKDLSGEDKFTDARKPAVSGMFYPVDKHVLDNDISDYLGEVKKKISARVRALIVPHAGYTYSGKIAAHGYKEVWESDIDTVIILGPSHTKFFEGASIANKTHYETPFGLAEISERATKIKVDLEREGLFPNNENIHDNEHSIEVQIPFIQQVLSKAKIIPVVIGSDTSFDELGKIGEILKKYIDERTLVVVSSDFTHYGSRFDYIPFTDDIENKIKDLDYGAIEFIEKKDAREFYKYVEDKKATICGKLPITILLSMFQDTDENVTVLKYDTSGSMTGDFSNSVSYASIALWGEERPLLDANEKKYLLGLARKTIENAFSGKGEPEVDEEKLSDNLKKVQGGFVTLHKDGALRGCIGHIIPQEPLYRCIMHNAANAAFHDSRFSPVTKEELSDIDIEISVLTVPEELDYSSTDELLEMIVPLKDGVILKNGWSRSTFLPQVWEQLPDKTEFFENLCAKAGMRKDCWKDKNTVIEVYHAFVFEEDRQALSKSR